jgi:uncharacterized membrane protein
MDMRPPASSRLLSLDALRGTVMVIMAIDHIRDFFDRSAMAFSPTDLTQTTPILFFTRWITHFCLPVFLFCAGAGAFLWWKRGNRTKRELSWFLLTRGLWFIILELIVMNFAYNFNISSQNLILLLVLYIFGACMILLSALIHLPLRLLAAVSIAIIALHNLLDPIRAESFGSHAWAWNLFHQPGVFTALERAFLVIYPIFPWIGVMAAGFCFGHILMLEEVTRRRITLRLGLAMTTLFFLLRAINIYGDPSHWSAQKSAVFTVLSFFNCTKYPGSLDYILMTLGPAFLFLVWLDRRQLKSTNPLIVFGRVPLFYFVLHFYAIHAILVIMSWIRYGSNTFSFIFHTVPSLGGPREIYPADFGYPLWVTYAVWIGLVLALYPLCKWFARIKATHRNPWLSYL